MNLKRLMDSKRIKDGERSVNQQSGGSRYTFTVDGVAIKIISNAYGTTIHRYLDKVGRKTLTGILQKNGYYAVDYNDYSGEVADVRELGEFNLADTLSFIVDFKMA
jgi:hypothetical protein